MAELVIDKVEASFTLLDKYWPIINENLPANEKKLFRYISNYRDKNFAILSSPYLLNYPIFIKEDFAIVLNCCGINEKEAIKDFVDADIPNNINKPLPKSAPFPMAMIILMKYYMEKKDRAHLDMIFYYFAYSIYWTVYTKLFSKFLPREETMVYTVNNMSNKFKLKQLGSIDKLLYDSVSSTIESTKERVLRCSNAEIFYESNLCRNSINNFMRSIVAEYMKNYNDNKVVYISADLYSEEGARLDNASSISTNIDKLANEYTTKFFSHHPNLKLATLAKSKVESVNPKEIISTITAILDERDIDSVSNFFRSLFYLYFDANPSKDISTVKSIFFIASMEGVYKKGNSKNKNVILVKESLDHWLKMGSVVYNRSNRPSTINDMKKGLYMYFLLFITSNET